jgi:putative addiction module killer protein
MYVVQETDEFREWLDGLKDFKAQVRIAARLRSVGAGNLGDWGPIEGPLSELRVHVGPGYRLYFVRRGTILIVLLNGGDKGSQKRDIQRAKKILSELEDDDDEA